MAAENEIAQQLERRRRAVAELWNLGDEAVVIGAGEPISIPGRADLTYRFRAHSEYFYLTDRERPGGALAYDAREGWRDFVVPVSRAERLWEGGPADGDEGEPVSGLERWLIERESRPVVWLGVQERDNHRSDGLTGELRRGLNQVRRAKDEVELQRMRTAEAATRAGFALARPMLTPGTSERQVQVEMEAEFLRHGADLPAYETIVGGGPNSAVLHFAPGGRRFRDGELVLIDAGGEYRGYASDVTRTYPVSGDFSPVQAELHGIVQRALDEATAGCRSGTEWRDVHLTAAKVIAEGLVNCGLLHGELETLLQRGTVSLFFPHGVGHMVGLGVRDAGEVLPGRKSAPGMPALRMDLPLAAGYVVTVEPGLYFVPALLGDQQIRDEHRDAVDFERVDELLSFGGIRLEQNVLVTDSEPDVLTADIPLVD
jgi:Xaa-Pro aminopeptidase